MSDTIQYAALSSRLDSINDNVKDLKSMNRDLAVSVSAANLRIEKLSADLKDLREDFNKMVEDQARTANLQRAISELVRVRQEIDQKYGNYTQIRQTMLGVLQATDVALVRKTTISKVSEELMLSTPEYWLAPCLVAVAAWISNDRELADRAVKEAIRRDEEKTALAMALICRRNGRIQTGYEWLSMYFAKQSATSFTEESFTYIDAYVNGVFGPDERHACQGYVSKWIDEVRGNKSNFEASQVETWKHYCEKFSRNTSGVYPDLEKYVPEYGKIKRVVGRIRGMEDIKNNFKHIQEAFVDQESMKKAVDAELIRLIGNYDKSEMEIRREEEYLSLVKFFRGDEEKARAEMQSREAKRLRRKLDFIEQMASEITDKKETTPSRQKTAVTFLSSYINKGANRYIAEPKEEFPEEITLKIDEWTGKSRDGTEYERLSREYEAQMNAAREDTLKYATSTKPKRLKAASVITLILAMVSGALAAVMGATALFVVAAVLLVISGICMLTRKTEVNHLEQRIEGINTEFDTRIRIGKQTLAGTLHQWKDARKVVDGFDIQNETRVVA